MNSAEIKAEIAKVEQEFKKLAEDANAKFHILSGMKNAYNKVLASFEANTAALEQDAKKDAVKDIAIAASNAEKKL